MINFQNYRNNAVRDLAWVIMSSPLLKNNTEQNIFFDNNYFESQYTEFGVQLKNLDENPAALLAHIKERNTHLLGKYFESLVEYWLRNSSDKELLAHNLQVFRGRNTIGEFDFIYRDLTNNNVFHLECAGKFYIAHKNSNELSNFIGPNSIDNLERKIKKIINDQIALAKMTEGKETLFIEGIEEEVNPKIFLKGYLFYYADLFFENAFLLPKFAEPNHSKGWWIYEKDIDYFFSQHKSKWIVVKRMNWISKAIVFNDDDVLSNTELRDVVKSYFIKNTYPLLIAELKYNDDNFYEEISRGFIVSNTWPNSEL